MSNETCNSPLDARADGIMRPVRREEIGGADDDGSESKRDLDWICVTARYFDLERYRLNAYVYRTEMRPPTEVLLDSADEVLKRLWEESWAQGRPLGQKVLDEVTDYYDVCLEDDEDALIWNQLVARVRACRGSIPELPDRLEIPAPWLSVGGEDRFIEYDEETDEALYEDVVPLLHFDPQPSSFMRAERPVGGINLDIEADDTLKGLIADSIHKEKLRRVFLSKGEEDSWLFELGIARDEA